MSALPDTFIVGAPKCGTTSLAAWLSDHPDVVVSTPKEPHYWSRDIRTAYRVSSSRYAGMFAPGRSRRVTIDASTLYLYSRAAIPAITAEIPEARFIVCTRDPVAMALSLYRHQRRIGFETAPSFAQAWDLQGPRLRGEQSLPTACPDAQVLQYGPICTLGEQLQRLLTQVAAERVLVLGLDEIASDPSAVYERVLGFLGLEPDGRSVFRPENEGGEPRWRMLQAGLRLASRLKFALGINRSFGLARHNRVVRQVDANMLDPATRATLDAYFEADQALLADLIEQHELSRHHLLQAAS